MGDTEAGRRTFLLRDGGRHSAVSASHQRSQRLTVGRSNQWLRCLSHVLAQFRGRTLQKAADWVWTECGLDPTDPGNTQEEPVFDGSLPAIELTAVELTAACAADFCSNTVGMPCLSGIRSASAVAAVC